MIHNICNKGQLSLKNTAAEEANFFLSLFFVTILCETFHCSVTV